MPDFLNIDLTTAEWLLFLVAGFVTGVINTLAGSGSLITLPIFVFVCGLPAPIANGTNRIGVLLQSAVGLATYRKSGAMDLGGSKWIVTAVIIGAVVGALIAVDLNEEAMNTTLGLLMVFMAIVLLLKPSRWIHDMEIDSARSNHPLAIGTYFLIGVYGGFIQAGVGIFLLAALVLISRYTLRSGNGVKLLVVFLYTIPGLAVFFWNGQVHLGYGLAMAVFQAFGAWIGVRWVIRFEKADVWIHRLLIVVVAAAAFKFLFAN
ncbi:MAG: sulfite exporter TauE/SafE family protein [Proteobacteria bacterium]|nr:sulfite exporter TauE/SafE family protein [Pseudomonadota bacterium]